jgi:hypothetical protein
MLKQGLKAIAMTHDIPGHAVELYAHILLATMIEVAFLTSRSPNPPEAVREAMKTVDALLNRLLP